MNAQRRDLGRCFLEVGPQRRATRLHWLPNLHARSDMPPLKQTHSPSGVIMGVSVTFLRRRIHLYSEPHQPDETTCHAAKLPIGAIFETLERGTIKACPASSYSLLGSPLGICALA